MSPQVLTCAFLISRMPVATGFSLRLSFTEFAGKYGSLTFGVGWGLGRDGLFFEGTLRLKMSELAQENTDAAMLKWGPYLGPI